MSGNPELVLEEKMAIQAVGDVQEQMDVSTDDSPNYVSLPLKGPGRRIQMRPDESEFKNGNYTGPFGPNTPCSEYVIDRRVDVIDRREESFLDKRVGGNFTFNKSVADDIDNLREGTKNGDITDKELNAKIDLAKLENQFHIIEEDRTEIDARFRSQSEIVSIVKKPKLDKPKKITTSPKKRNQQKETKKSIGSKKSSPGKSNSSLNLVKKPVPYNKWMHTPVKDIVDKLFVDIDGSIHKVELALVPVESHATLKLTNDPSSENDIFSEGTIDRPPDEGMSLEGHYNPAGAVNAGAHTQPSTTNHSYVGSNIRSHSNEGTTTGRISAPYIYCNDQPLDLSVGEKPLDLSMRNKTENEVEDFHPNQEDREVAHVMENSTANEITAESNITQQIIGDSNLPSLGRLTLENDNQVQSFTAVQDSAVQEATDSNCQDNPTSGQQYILNLVASGQVSFDQLWAQYCMNQMQKSVNNPTSNVTIQQANVNPSLTTQSQSSVPHIQEANVNPSLATQSQNGVPQAAEDQGNPELDMPNLCSLGLANEEGGLLISKQERLKDTLKDKLLKKKEDTGK